MKGGGPSVVREARERERERIVLTAVTRNKLGKHRRDPQISAAFLFDRAARR